MNIRRYLTPQTGAIIGVMVLALAVTSVFNSRPAVTTQKKPLLDFPLVLGPWTGVSMPMEIGIADFLELSDYIIANFFRGTTAVNLYIAYYDSLNQGAFPHSPTLCIPGGGWEIEKIGQAQIGGEEVRRVVISKNGVRQIVYYWYQQDDRFVADEYWLKWNTFKRVLDHGRSDTSLVRLTIQIGPGESERDADATLARFFALVKPEILKRLA